MENYIEVIKKIQENPNDEEAVNALVRDYWDYGVRIARSVLMQYENFDSTVVEDLLQNSWIKVLRSISSLTEQKGFAAWYSKIVTNTCIDYLRSSSVRFERSMPQVQNDEEDYSSDIEIIDDTIEHQPEMAYDQQVRKAIIEEVLKQLSPEQRQVIVMRYYEGLSMKDISEQLGIPMSTVEGRSRVASVKIRDSVTEIQKRDDIKLYNLTPLPFFIWLLRDNEEKIKIPHSFVPNVMDKAGAASAAVKAGTGTAAKAAAYTASAAAKTAGASGLTKILAGIAAAAVILGGGYAVVSQSGRANGTAKTADTEISENIENAEEPIIEETPEPVKDVEWIVEPQLAFTGVRELIPWYIANGEFDIYKEKTGYPDEWERNETGQRRWDYTGDAIEVIQGTRSGIYDYSGNELYPVSLKKNILVYTAEDYSPIVSSFDGSFRLGEDGTQVFSTDYKKIETGDALAQDIPPYPFARKYVNGKIMVYSIDEGKDVESSYNGGSYCLMEERDSNNTMLGYVILDGNGNYIDKVQSDTPSIRIVNGFITVQKNGKYTYQIAKSGELISDYIYEDAKYFMDGYAPVKKNGKWGFIDETGKEVTEFIFDDASMLYHGHTYVSLDGVYGILNLPEVLESGVSITAETCHADPEKVEKAKQTIISPIGKATVNVGNLNVRKAPTTKADLAAKSRSIKEGSIFNVYAITEADGYTWYQIDDEMWIASDGKWVTYKEN